MNVKKYDEMERLATSAAGGTVLAVTGPDPYQSSRLLDMITLRFRRDLGYDVFRHDGAELVKGDVRRLLAESSLFSSGKLLVISRVHKLGKAPAGELLDALDSDLGDNAIFMTSDRVPRESALIRKLQKIVPVYICYEPFERDIPGWIRRLASEEGIELDRKAAGLLGQYSGRNLQRLSGAITQLALYHGAGSRIGEDGVRGILSGRGGMDVFRLGDMIFADRRGDALDTLSRLLTMGEEPIGLIAYLFSLWQKVVIAREVLDGGGGRKEVTARTGARYPLLDKLMDFAAAAHRSGIAEASEAFAEADYGLKTGEDSMAAFSGLIFTLTTGP
jgi:DNA polymerase III delta subunit